MEGLGRYEAPAVGGETPPQARPLWRWAATRASIPSPSWSRSATGSRVSPEDVPATEDVPALSAPVRHIPARALRPLGADIPTACSSAAIEDMPARRTYAGRAAGILSGVAVFLWKIWPTGNSLTWSLGGGPTYFGNHARMGIWVELS